MIKAPVNNPKVTSPYGNGMLNGKPRFHDGIDFIGSSTDVYAVAPGVVTYDFNDYDAAHRWDDPKHSAGNYIIIETRIDGKTYFCRYLHLGENYVSYGQEIKAGEKIGVYADAGYSFGAHLHFDMYTDKWLKIDPTPFFEGII